METRKPRYVHSSVLGITIGYQLEPNLLTVAIASAVNKNNIREQFSKKKGRKVTNDRIKSSVAHRFCADFTREASDKELENFNFPLFDKKFRNVLYRVVDETIKLTKEYAIGTNEPKGFIVDGFFSFLLEEIISNTDWNLVEESFIEKYENII